MSWLAGALLESRRTLPTEDLHMTTCRRCGRRLLNAKELAEQADGVMISVAGAVSLAQGGHELEESYGGAYGLRRALETHLFKAEVLVLEHARAASCVAGACIPASGSRPR